MNSIREKLVFVAGAVAVLLAATVGAQGAGSAPAEPEKASAEAAPPAADPAAKAEPAQPVIDVEISDIRSDKGEMIVWLWSGDNGWLKDDTKSVEKLRGKIVGGKSNITFTKVKRGVEYAVSTCHDENDNKQCDMSFFGFPKEGVACSNLAHQKNMIPKYAVAAFKLDQDKLKVTVSQLKY